MKPDNDHFAHMLKACANAAPRRADVATGVLDQMLKQGIAPSLQSVAHIEKAVGAKNFAALQDKIFMSSERRRQGYAAFKQEQSIETSLAAKEKAPSKTSGWKWSESGQQDSKTKQKRKNTRRLDSPNPVAKVRK